jgi:hypothetical protein
MNRTTKLSTLLGVAALSSVAFATPNYASLVTFKNYTGNVGLSTDGFGSTSQVGVISASAPAGSTVLAAYLYSATFNSQTTLSGVTLNGVSVNFTASAPNSTACCSLSSFRADVTSLVAGVINGGGGGVYNFNIDEGSNGNIDGEALVVVYSNPTLGVSTIGILDGFASVTGDTTTISFAQALDPTAPGFVADMLLGIGFSCCEQKSTVNVNGSLLTENAGNNNDGLGSIANGQLITVGSFDDPYSPNLPSYADDTEKYSLIPYLKKGDTSITIDTLNSSEDDNIFLAAFQVTGEAKIGPPSAVPLPAGAWLFATGLAALGANIKRRRKVKAKA